MAETPITTNNRRETPHGVFYSAVWKWHFLASLYVLPFFAMLALTGGVYLYKSQIENWLYADQITVSIGETVQPYEDQIAALAAQTGLTRVRGVTTYGVPDRSTMIEFNDADGVRSIAWVDPYSAEVLGVVERDEMPMRLLRKFHGELLLGDVGTKFVELSAHWAIVMFITGAYLWWPRGARTFRKATQLPNGKGRKIWRETHMFTGFLAVILIVPILISGLPWTDVWGGGLKYVQEQTNQKRKSLRFGRAAPNSTTDNGDTISIADAYHIAEDAGLSRPYELRPPRNETAAYWIRSASKNRFEQSELVIDQYSGDILARVDFADNPPVAMAVSLGISFHQGELYGRLNLIQNTIASIVGLILAISGFAAWWQRRPAGSLGVPAAPQTALGTGMIALIVALGLLFPLMGASLLVALSLDWLLFKRLKWFQQRATLTASRGQLIEPDLELALDTKK